MNKFLIISFVFSFLIIGIQTSASEETRWKNTTCGDTDGGSNPYVFGKVTLTNPPSDGTIPNLSDMCYSSLVNIHGDSCTGEGCQVMENYCVDINDDNIDDTYNSAYFNCPNGCNKGACITTKNTIPTIKVLSPKGGEKYETGQQIFVKWETENISEDNKNFSITLQGYDKDGIVASSYKLATNTINDGEEVVTLPKKFTSPVSFGQNFTIFI